MPELQQTLYSAGTSGAERSSRKHPHRTWQFVAAAAFALFLAFSIGYSLTRSPWWDEGVFADVAMNFRNFGHLGSTVMAPRGYLNWPGVHEYTYWQFPLYLLVEGAWIRLFPPTIEWMRLLSVLWGCLYLASWFLFARGVTKDQNLSLFLTSVIALDYAVIATASNGRMEMMCGALEMAALASYINLRAVKPKLAIIMAGFFGAISLFCHPMGLVTNLCIVAVILFLDWRRIPWSAVPVASLFYAVGIALCVRYALEAPKIYSAQTSAAVVYRESSLPGILRNVATDFYHRYYGYYFASLTGVNKFKCFALLFGVAGFFVIIANRALRSQLIAKLLLLLAVVSYAGVAAVDNQDHAVYFIYSMPFVTACGAFWVYDQWPRRGLGRLISSGLLLAALTASLAGFAIKIHQNGLRNQYDPAIAVIRKNLPPGGIVDGGSELGFALGFQPRLVDDRYIGYWSHGALPDVYAENRYYVPVGHEETVWNASRKLLAQQYRLIFHNDDYRIYLRNDLPVRQ